MEPRQLMCVLHLAKLGAGELTYFQLAGKKYPMPAMRYARLQVDDAAREDAFAPVEEEAASMLRRRCVPGAPGARGAALEPTAPMAPPPAPRPSSGEVSRRRGLCDSFGRPLRLLWMEDSASDEEAGERSPAAPEEDSMTEAEEVDEEDGMGMEDAAEFDDDDADVGEISLD